MACGAAAFAVLIDHQPGALRLGVRGRWRHRFGERGGIGQALLGLGVTGDLLEGRGEIVGTAAAGNKCARRRSRFCPLSSGACVGWWKNW